MDNVSSRQPSGSLKISKGVIAMIAKSATLEIEGIHSLPEHDSGTGIFAGGFRKRPIRVMLRDDFAEIGISIVLEFGAKIPSVCAAVQSAVKDSIQTMTGIAVYKVNVVVVGIHFPAEGEDAGL